MAFVHFKKEFEKLARKKGMGDAIAAGSVCYKAREVLNEVFPKGEGAIKSFEKGLLTINFGSSSALASFNILKAEFLEKLNNKLDGEKVVGIKALIG
ncbi:hypothetical protein HOG48_02550 [Candidatus Peregrinibacteria bacterium]|jgi:hypothetical protein|nr:hypothetical protein [Candidatus Peregrinibacteria bacterium]